MILFIAVFGLTLISLTISFLNPPQSDGSVILLEIAKAFLQLSVIVVIGGYIKIVYQRAETERARLAELNEFRKGLVDDLVHLRTSIDRVRRHFKITESTRQLRQYKQAIADLIDLRIRIDRIWHNFETSSTSFSRTKDIKDNLNIMRNYLISITKEYKPDELAEILRLTPDKSPAEFLENVPVFSEFIEAKAGGSYKRAFLPAYSDALKLVRKDILSGELPNTIGAATRSGPP